MRSQMRGLWPLLIAAIALLPAIGGPLSLLAKSPSPSMVECPWPEANGVRLLDRQVGALHFTEATVQEVWAELALGQGVPLSFIHGDPEMRISLRAKDGTLRQVLDEVVTRAPAYRYDVVAGHLVLYSRDEKWKTQISDFRLGPGSRLQLAWSMAEELNRRLPSVFGLAGPGIKGDPSSYVYQDKVAVVGPGSVLDLLVQLLGSRPSAVFYIIKEKWGSTDLWIGGVDLLKSIQVTAPSTVLQGRDETVQLRVLATQQDGTTRDLSANSCGTNYRVSDDRVLAVSSDGLVSVRGGGDAEVKAWNEHVSGSISFKVILLPKPSAPGTKP